MLKDYRLRYKTTPTADDPTWAASNTDPNMLRITVGGTTTAGTYRVTLTPEDTALSAVSFEFARVAEADAAIATGLAAAANVLAATADGRQFLVPSGSSASSAVLIMAVQPGAPTFSVSLTVPGSATMTPDHTGILPIMAQAKSPKGSLSIVAQAITSAGVPLAPGSGTVDLRLVSVVDRSRPRGKSGPKLVQPAAVIDHDFSDNQALGAEWVVNAPAGMFTVQITGDASLPGSTNAIEVWVSETVANVTEAA